MSASQKTSETGQTIPQAKVKRREWRFPFVWVIPIVAAIVAGYLVFQRVHQLGPRITIQFKDASGLKIDRTPIQFRGISVGEVTGVELSKDQRYAVVKARLRRSAASIAREGSVFWIVRPEVGIANITGLGTIIAGPHIEVLPGTGEAASKFVGQEKSPVALERNGLKIILSSNHLGALKPGSPVYYRGVEVGAVQDCQLSTNAAIVDISVFIRNRYTNLVWSGSKFWNVSGMDVKIGLFRGAEINVESLRSLLAGGIAFATPNGPNDAPATNGMVFRLHDEAKKEWLDWNPVLEIPAEK